MRQVTLRVSNYGQGDERKAEPYLQGKAIASVEQSEYAITFTFDDGSTLKCSGASYDGNSLDVEFIEAPESPTLENLERSVPILGLETKEIDGEVFLRRFSADGVESWVKIPKQDA